MQNSVVNGLVVEVRRYAVKSMLGEVLPDCMVEEQGLCGDRMYALLDSESGKVASAKRPRPWAALLGFRATYADQPGRGRPVVVEAPDGESRRSDHPGFDTWLSKAVGRRVNLVGQPLEGASYEDEWPDVDGMAPADFIESTRTSTSEDGLAVSTLAIAMMAPGTFQDVSPVTILTTASLREAQRLHPSGDWDPRRFRANLLLDVPGDGFVENDWTGRRLTVGGAVLEVVAPTPRCVMPTLAQEELPADRGVLKIAAIHNRVDTGFGIWACLGAYATVVTPGPVAVGDDFSLA